MSNIALKSLAQLKREIIEPHRILIIDRHDTMDHSLRRSRELVEIMTQPMKISAHKKTWVSYQRAGHTIYFYFPKASDIEFNGTNSFTVLNNAERNEKITYRLENEGDDFPPSKLAENHPFIGNAELEAENKAKIKARDEKIEKDKELEKRRAAIRAIPAPPSDPRYEKYQADIKTAVTAALDAKLFYTTEVNKFVGDYLANSQNNTIPDFGVPSKKDDFIVTVEDPQEQYVTIGEFCKNFALNNTRGSWTVIRINTPKWTGIRSTIIVTGNHDKPYFAEQSMTPYTDTTIMDRMRGHEIYDMRKIVEYERTKINQTKALQEAKLEVGSVIGPLKIGQDLFPKMRVTEINTETGDISMIGKKYRSPRTFTGTLNILKIISQLKDNEIEKKVGALL